MTSLPRQLAIDQAREALADKPVYLDTETTGLEERAEIVDICILDDQGRVLLDTLVKPKRKIPPEATKVHGITDAMVATAPTWKALYPQVQTLLARRRIAIYNADYDARLLYQTTLQYGLEWALVEDQFFCIMKLYAQFYGQWDNYHGNYKWHKLELAGQHCRLNVPNAHRAKADTLLARAVLHYMAKQK